MGRECFNKRWLQTAYPAIISTYWPHRFMRCACAIFPKSISILPGFLLVSFLTTSSFADTDSGNAVRGREISQLHCTRCHVVGDYNPNGGISSTPSFQLLVKRRPDYKERFNTFYARRPHLSFVTMEGFERHMAHLPTNVAPITLKFKDIADILAFIEELKPK